MAGVSTALIDEILENPGLGAGDGRADESGDAPLDVGSGCGSIMNASDGWGVAPLPAVSFFLAFFSDLVFERGWASRNCSA